MPTKYHASLQKGKITYRNGIYKGSDGNAVTWSPVNPNTQGGWQEGDTLGVAITLDVNPSVSPQPGANEYVGLCVGACSADNATAVTNLINEAERIITPNVGKLLGSHISTSVSKSSDLIFYNAQKTAHTVSLNNGQLLEDYITYWEMTYNAQNNVVKSGEDVEIVFGYGDPQEADSKT